VPISLSKTYFIFVWKIVRTPLPVVDKDNHLSKPIFSRIFTVQRRNLFQDSNFPKSYLPPIRGSSWHKNEIKMIRTGHYSSNNFQYSTKTKSTEKKTLGYLQRVLFFNVFELRAESGNQVFSSDEALRSIAEVFSTRYCILSK
jgi:hypothetical protein